MKPERKGAFEFMGLPGIPRLCPPRPREGCLSEDDSVEGTVGYINIALREKPESDCGGGPMGTQREKQPIRPGPVQPGSPPNHLAGWVPFQFNFL